MFNECAVFQITKRERVIRSIGDLVFAHDTDQIPQRILVMGDSIYPEFALIVIGVLDIIDIDQIRSAVPPMTDPSQCMGKGPSAMCKHDLQIRIFVKDPPNIIEQMALDVSAGMPTSQGSQYFSISF